MVKPKPDHQLSESERAYKFAPGEVAGRESPIRWWKLDLSYALSLCIVAGLVLTVSHPNDQGIDHVLLAIQALLFVPLAVVVVLDLGPWLGDIGGTYPTPYGMKVALSVLTVALNFLLLAWSNTLKTPVKVHFYFADGWRLALALGLNTLYMLLFVTRKSAQSRRR